MTMLVSFVLILSKNLICDFMKSLELLQSQAVLMKTIAPVSVKVQEMFRNEGARNVQK